MILIGMLHRIAEGMALTLVRIHLAPPTICLPSIAPSLASPLPAPSTRAGTADFGCGGGQPVFHPGPDGATDIQRHHRSADVGGRGLGCRAAAWCHRVLSAHETGL